LEHRIGSRAVLKCSVGNKFKIGPRASYSGLFTAG
jgi:hypothetical protein